MEQARPWGPKERRDTWNIPDADPPEMTGVGVQLFALLPTPPTAPLADSFDRRVWSLYWTA